MLMMLHGLFSALKGGVEPPLALPLEGHTLPLPASQTYYGKYSPGAVLPRMTGSMTCLAWMQETSRGDHCVSSILASRLMEGFLSFWRKTVTCRVG